ncbi:penicillin-binding protein activator [Gluconacetobacter johannae]|uniref:Penicillin-binding protein activator n=2 Tax=Gluconacetobacter johannae TaxID=112140 RepID=A0A7W4J851_9PROT|nr:penicillin-binding protein activator [Gluconacetobacter johannae]
MAASLAGLAACAGPSPSGPAIVGPVAPPPIGAPVPPGRTVGVLLPLGGPNARLGQEMLAATRLALDSPAAPPLDVRDTAAPGGAGAAAQAAVAAGDGVILGPLTAGDTAQAATVAASASVPLLAYTSDVSLGRPGVWVLGIAPEQQVTRLVAAARAEGRQHFAAFLPDNALGRAMGTALTQVCAAQGLPTPVVIYHTTSQASITQGLKTLSDYDSRLAAVQDAAQAATAPDAAAVDPLAGAVPAVPAGTAAPAAAPPPPRLGPPPFDALLLADTGLQLGMVIDALNTVQVTGAPAGAAPAAGSPAGPPQVRLLGSELWGVFAGKLGRLQGAWYAAPDPASRQRFIQIFMARYHHMPTPLADLSYDSAALVGALDRARTEGQPNGYTVEALTRPDGFSGVDGVFGLTPDGRTRRDMAIFQIQPGGGGRIVVPAAGRLARDGSQS